MDHQGEREATNGAVNKLYIFTYDKENFKLFLFVSAGRCSPGVCFHLFSRQRFKHMSTNQIPAMQRMPIHVYFVGFLILQNIIWKYTFRNCAFRQRLWLQTDRWLIF